MYRRSLLASALGAFVPRVVPNDWVRSQTSDTAVQTLEAFADTLIPGSKRFLGDVAVAGVASGPSGACVGYIELLADLGLEQPLDAIAALLNGRAFSFAAAHWIGLPVWPAPFVALSYAHRSSVVTGLFQRSDPDRDLWVTMAFLSSLAFDAAADRVTVEAARQAHPGLEWLRFPQPDSDGLWRYAEFSYRKRLADEHPSTTCSGQPT